MLKKSSVKSSKRTTRGAYAKLAEQNQKHGRASNRTGITYAARGAGRGAEHFEPKTGVKHSHGSAKAHPTKGPRRKTKETRIVAG